ncbi:IS3 family transposase, partial [Planomonospora parontospora]
READVLEKSSRLLRGRESMTLAKYELIDAEKAHHKIAKMCAWLEVSRSGYYEWRQRPASATAQRRVLLARLVSEIFHDAHETYGYRRVHAELLRRGESCSAELVRALMREQGLVPAQVRAFRPTTTAQGAFRGIPDLVGRDFTATRPGLKLVGYLLTPRPQPAVRPAAHHQLREHPTGGPLHRRHRAGHPAAPLNRRDTAARRTPIQGGRRSQPWKAVPGGRASVAGRRHRSHRRAAIV